MSKRKLLGMADVDQAISRTHRGMVSKGMERWHARKLRKRLEKRRNRKPRTELTRYQNARSTAKRRYRKRLAQIAYAVHGLVPHTGTGKRRQEYEIQMNFLSLQYPNGRWDLDEEDWMRIWQQFPEELRLQFQLVRVDPEGPFSPENVQVEPRQLSSFNKTASTKNQ